MLMQPRFRHAELLSTDAMLRLAIYDREDHRFQIIEERVRSYELEGDEGSPDYVPFPCGPDWEPFWHIEATPINGVFGSAIDALRESKFLLANGS